MYKVTFSCSINCKVCHFHEPLSLSFTIMHLLLQTPKMDHEKVRAITKQNHQRLNALNFIINIHSHQSSTATCPYMSFSSSLVILLLSYSPNLFTQTSHFSLLLFLELPYSFHFFLNQYFNVGCCCFFFIVIIIITEPFSLPQGGRL